MYLCAVDIGGTFTDCALVDPNGKIFMAKTPSTPEDFSKGFFESIRLVSEQIGMSLENLLGQVELYHGSTVATNALVERRGAKTGLITTRGHRDVLLMMRGAGRTAGLSVEEYLHVSKARKPDPIVPKSLICEITERIDCMGQVVVPLNKEEVKHALKELLDAGVEAIAVSFLWSFKNNTHEQEVKALISEMHPGIFVTVSSDLIPKWGEYERTVATVFNSYLGPVCSRYLERMEKRYRSLRKDQSKYSLLVMQCTGGVIPAEDATMSPLLLVDSGPVGGVVGSKFFGDIIGQKNIIATDVGGTTFDVGIIFDGQLSSAKTSIKTQYEYFVPTVDVKSIGAGGGSIAWVDEISKTIRVGPESAGADPGPVCYKKGGTKPTLTDADVVLGFINPDYFLGGRIPLDRDAALSSIKKLGSLVGLTEDEAAAGIARIAESRMAELLRQATIEKGFDPRDFVVFCYGGAGPTHGAAYARELGAKAVITPLGAISSVWSALGIASSDLLTICEKTDMMVEPFDLKKINESFRSLEELAKSKLINMGMPEDKIEIFRFTDMRYRAQVNEVEIQLPGGPLEDRDLEKMVESFHSKYEALYGKGSGYREAGLEILLLRCRGFGYTRKPEITRTLELNTKPSDDSFSGRRLVYWYELGRRVETPIYFGANLKPGNVINGPAIIELPETTIIVHPEEEGKLDTWGNFVITI